MLVVVVLALTYSTPDLLEVCDPLMMTGKYDVSDSESHLNLDQRRLTTMYTAVTKSGLGTWTWGWGCDVGCGEVGQGRRDARSLTRDTEFGMQGREKQQNHFLH